VNTVVNTVVNKMANVDVMNLLEKNLKGSSANSPVANVDVMNLLEKNLKGFSANSPVVTPKKNASFMDRLKLSFGNEEGQEEFTSKKGIKKDYDPSPTEGMTFLDAIQGGWVKPAVDDFTNDIADIVPNIGQIVTQILGTSGGATVGGIIGSPLGPVGAAAGAAGGGYIGNILSGLATEKAKQKIGESLGTYKSNGDFMTPEMTTGAGVDATLPFALGALKVPGRVIGQAALKRYSQLLGLTSAHKSTLKDTAKKYLQTGKSEIEKTALQAIEKGIYGKDAGKNLYKMAKETGEEMESLLINKEIKYSDILNVAKENIEGIADKKSTVEKVASIFDDIMDFQKNKYFKDDNIKIGSPSNDKIKSSIDDALKARKDVLDYAKKYLSKNEADLLETQIRSKISDSYDSVLKGALPDSQIKYSDLLGVAKENIEGIARKTSSVKKVASIFDDIMDFQKNKYFKDENMRPIVPSNDKIIASAQDALKAQRDIVNYAKKYLPKNEVGLLETQIRSRIRDSYRDSLEKVSSNPKRYAELNKIFKDFIIPVEEGLTDSTIKEMRREPFSTSIMKFGPSNIQNLLSDLGIVEGTTLAVKQKGLGDMFQSIGRLGGKEGLDEMMRKILLQNSVKGIINNK